MTRVNRRSRSGGLMLIIALLAGCGGAQQAEPRDPVALLVAGRYAEARSAAEAGSGDELMDRAVVALSHLAESLEPQYQARALDALITGGNEVAAAAAADSMLGLVTRLPADVPDAVSLAAVEVALAAAGRGPMARVQAGPVPGSEVARSLAASLLERLHLWLATGDVAPDPTRLLDAWNGSYSLLGGSMDAGGDDPQAWRLYTAIGGLAVTLDSIARDSDLTKVVLRTAVEVVEHNPSITIAVRCDLASPFDDLRAALTYDRELLGRLERAVAPAVGCSRGKYAPQSTR